MLLKIAWRNIWRSKLRSLIVIIAIALGIWSGIFLMSFSAGMNNQRTRDALELSIGHIQIHSAAFNVEQNVSNWLQNPKALETILDTSALVAGYSKRIILNGMVSSALTATGARIAGVDENFEKKTSNVYSKIIEGTWFEDTRKNQIVIGEKLANKHKLRLKSKLVLSFQDPDGNIVTGLFRVGGIFKSSNSKWDEMNVFVRSKDLFPLLSETDKYHEIIVLLKDIENATTFADILALADAQDEVKSWRDVAPDLAYADDMMKQFLYIFMSIIMLALMFGIVNNMLMAILERRRELGMLMAIGFNKTKLFTMILLETVLLGFIGAPVGLFLGWLTVSIFSTKGIDLSIVGQGLESLGMATIIYPEFESNGYWVISIMVVVTAIIASIFPAIKALKLNPVEAIRTL